MIHRFDQAAFFLILINCWRLRDQYKPEVKARIMPDNFTSHAKSTYFVADGICRLL